MRPIACSSKGCAADQRLFCRQALATQLVAKKYNCRTLVYRGVKYLFEGRVALQLLNRVEAVIDLPFCANFGRGHIPLARHERHATSPTASAHPFHVLRKSD